MNALPLIQRHDLGAFVDALPAGSVRVLAGITAARLAESLGAVPVRRPVVHASLPSHGSAGDVIEAVLSDLARAAAEIWPFWWNGEDLSDVGGDALSAMHLPLRLARLAGRVPELATGWARVAIARLVRGRLPRVRHASPEVEAEQLCRALAPEGLVLAVVCGSAIVPRQVGILEWLAAATGAAVLALADAAGTVEPPLDRIVYGGRSVAGEAIAGSDPLGPAGEGSGRADGLTHAREAAVLARPAVLGRPHPLSAVEQRMAKLIAADRELRALFAHNREIPGLRGPRARVDLVWPAGRVVVEFDGDEHSRARYRADRHRDYELLRAGYLVLRITNTEVLEDAIGAREKIRDIVRLRGPREEAT